MPCTATKHQAGEHPGWETGQAHAFCQALQHRLIHLSAWLRRRAMGHHRHQRASRASPTLTVIRRRPVPIHEGPGRWRHHVPAWLRAARELAAAGGHLEPLTFPVSRSPSVHRGDPVTVNLHCGGLARLRSRLAGGSAPAAPCDSSGISALAKIRFQLFRLVPVDGATPRWTADPS